MSKKRALGRGLDAILPADIEEEIFVDVPKGERLREIAIDSIVPNPMQPREDFDGEAFANLAESIRQQGILQPIIVAPHDRGYVLIAGERRWRAAKMIGFEKIPALVLEIKPSDDQLLFMALVENLQREDLNPIDEAEAYQMLMENFGLTQDQIAEKVGKSRPAVTNSIRLLKLPQPVLELLRARKITAGHARVLLEEKDEQRQIRLAQLAARRGLSVERLGILIIGKAERKKRSKTAKSPKILLMEEELSMALGTKVEILHGKKKNRLIIEFYSDGELEDFIERIMGVC